MSMDTSHEALPQGMFDPRTFEAELDTENPIDCCKSAIANATAYLHGQFRKGTQAAELIRLRARFIDILLASLWDRQDWGQSELALIAVGGYGRGELHP